MCKKYDFLLLLKDFRTLFYFQTKFELFLFMKLMQFHDFYVYQYFLRQLLDDLNKTLTNYVSKILCTTKSSNERILKLTR